MCDDPKVIPLKIFAKDVGNCAYVSTDILVLLKLCIVALMCK